MRLLVDHSQPERKRRAQIPTVNVLSDHVSSGDEDPGQLAAAYFAVRRPIRWSLTATSSTSAWSSFRRIAQRLLPRLSRVIRPRRGVVGLTQGG